MLSSLSLSSLQSTQADVVPLAPMVVHNPDPEKWVTLEMNLMNWAFLNFNKKDFVCELKERHGDKSCGVCKKQK